MRCCGSILIGGLEISFPWDRFSEYFEVVSLEMYNEKVVLLLHRFFASLPLSNQVRAKTTGQDKTQRGSPSYNSTNRQDAQRQHISVAPQQAQPPESCGWEERAPPPLLSPPALRRYQTQTSTLLAGGPSNQTSVRYRCDVFTGKTK